MKKVTNLSSRVYVMLCAALLLSGVLASSTQAQAARPLDDVLEDWQGYDWDWIVDVAGWEAQNDGPLYPSAPPTVPQYETFEGDFTPEDSNTKIAIFSDDGCDVYINGAKVHANLNHGQGLPDLSQSLRKIPYSFQGGVTYQIKVVYSNTYYTGQTDIDGASLFAYSDEAAPPPPPPPPDDEEPCQMHVDADQISKQSAHLYWSTCANEDFTSYKLHRSTQENFTPAETNRIDRGALENQRDKTEYEDTGLEASRAYYYVLVTTHAGQTTEARASITTLEANTPQMTFSGLARACAGGLAADGIHDFTITGILKDSDGNALINTSIKLLFKNNRGHDFGDGRAKKNSKYLPDITKGQAEVANSGGEAMTATTDAEGKVTIHVLSSDIISSDIKILAKWTNPQGTEKEVGIKSCDFAAVEGRRGFPDPVNPDAPDNGWSFQPEWLTDPGVSTTATLYIQFKADPNGADDAVNWKRVNNHTIVMTVGQVDLKPDRQGPATPTENYAFIVNQQHPELYASVSQTRNDNTFDGVADAVIEAGDKIDDAEQIWLHFYNLSQWDN